MSLDKTEESTKKKPRELLNLDVREVSLVDRPAIRREFLVVKREDTTKEVSTMSDSELHAGSPVNLEPLSEESNAEVFFTESDFDFSPSISEVEKMINPDLAKLLLAAARGLKGVSSGYEGEDRAKVNDAAKLLQELMSIKETKSKKGSKSPTKATEETDEALADDDEDETKQTKLKKVESNMTETRTPVPVSLSKRDDGTYDLAGVPEEMQATIQEVCKRHDVAVEKAAQLEEVLKAERDERLRRDYVEKAEKEFSNLPGTSVETGLLLKSLNDLDKELSEKVEGIFTAVNSQLENSSMLQEVGSPAIEAETTAWGRIEKQAAEMVAEGTISSKAAAISKVLELNPKLYSEYLKEGGN